MLWLFHRLFYELFLSVEVLVQLSLGRFRNHAYCLQIFRTFLLCLLFWTCYDRFALG
jgi:hypothetical protein